MDPTPLPTIEPFIPAEHAVPQETINDGLLFLRETLASIKQDGAYGTIILYAANPAEKPVPTIMFGFPIPPKNLPAVRHPPLPILLLQDGVSPSGLTSLHPSWVNESVMHNKIQISNNSLGLQNNVEGGGSFGGWLKDGPGRIYGLTCYHNLPGFKQGDEIVSPSTLEVTAKLQVTIDGTTYSAHPRKRLSPCLTKTVESLLAQYSLHENPSGVPLADGRVVTLSGPPLGRVIDGRLHNNALFLERHNLRLPPYAKFAVLPQAKSYLDFAIFQVSPERHGGNWVSLSGVAIDGPVTAVGDFRPGDIVTKIGRTTAKTVGSEGS
ncbi:hypothetical protein EV426DRAFT_663701 [Tirmania nivea]|nr:hypothetical protein EV426DRAFT_663701 [Tirmania nivea]